MIPLPADSGAHWSHTADLSAELGSVSGARSFVTFHLVDHDAAYLVDDVRQVVSELATNAIVHARSSFTVVLSGLPASILLEVLDLSGTAPVPRTAAALDLAGRGLAIVAALSLDWGVTARSAGGKTVWAEFAKRLA